MKKEPKTSTRNLKRYFSSFKNKCIVTFVGVSLTITGIALGTSLSMANAASCVPPSTTYGTDTMSVSQPSTTDQIWVRVQSPISITPNTTQTSPLQLQVTPPTGGNGPVCFSLGGTANIPANTWTWVHTDYANNPMTVTLPAYSASANNQTQLQLIGIQQGIEVDSILMLTNGCIPAAGTTGTNCTTGQLDTTPPTVSISAPSASATLTGTSTITANASDDVAVASVQFTVDGTAVGSPDTTSPYSLAWDSTTVANGNHTIAAVAKDTSGNSTTASSVTVSVSNVVVPPMVQNFKWNATNKTLTWNAYPNADAYTIATVHNPTTTRDTTYLSVTGTTYTPPVLNNVTVNYGISPTKGGPPVPGSTWLVPEVTVTWPDITPAPSAPTALQATAGSSTSVALTWTENNTSGGLTISGYDIYRNGVLIGGSTSTSYTDTTVSPNTSYQYTVDAFDVATPPHVSAQTSPASVTTPKTPPPTAPSSVSATANSPTSVAVSWSENNTSGGNQVAGFYILRNGIQIGSTSAATATNYTDNSVTSNTAYTYTVEAYDTASPANVSVASAGANITTPKTPPPTAPGAVTATANSYNNVSVSWGASSQSTNGLPVAGYYIIRNGVTLGQVSVTQSLSYSDITVFPQTSYVYSIEAFDTANPPNVSAATTASSVTTPAQPDTIPPTSPQNLIGIAASTSQINLSWTASTDNFGVSGYYVYRNGAKIATVNSTSYGDTGLNASTAYSYYVVAIDTATPPNTSRNSNTVSVTTNAQATTATVEGYVTSANTNLALSGVDVHTGIYGTSNGAATSISNSNGYYQLNLIRPITKHNYYYVLSTYKIIHFTAGFPAGVSTVNEALSLR